ncbi:MAG TPA: hypothetical protein VFR41_09025 [Acidimicrobiia bacterium]|nr:hypothetical protein [Acidimicrobiia bacterium]
MKRIALGAVAALLALAACSSGSKNGVKVGAAAVLQVTTTTQSRAIGLRVNADEAAEQVPDQPLTAKQQKALDQELAAARKAASRFPTVAAALKGGLVQAGLFTPGAGAHFISVAASMNGASGAVNPSQPEAWIYDGVSPHSKIVGLMYASFAMQPPSGFAGPNDHWHRHTNLCVTFAKGKIGIPFPPDGNVTPDQCKAKHGMFLHRTFWMVHAWVVPGWKSPQGVFSHANIDLHCGDGTDNVDAVGFCKGT